MRSINITCLFQYIDFLSDKNADCLVMRCGNIVLLLAQDESRRQNYMSKRCWIASFKSLWLYVLSSFDDDATCQGEKVIAPPPFKSGTPCYYMCSTKHITLYFMGPIIPPCSLKLTFIPHPLTYWKGSRTTITRHVTPSPKVSKP